MARISLLLEKGDLLPKAPYLRHLKALEWKDAQVGYMSDPDNIIDSANESEDIENVSEVYKERLILLVELCTEASIIGKQALERGEELDMLKAFDRALVHCLMSKAYNKNDLTSVWAMLLLGARTIRKFCMETGAYAPDLRSIPDQIEHHADPQLDHPAAHEEEGEQDGLEHKTASSE
jgi:hypothetical protein